MRQHRPAEIWVTALACQPVQCGVFAAAADDRVVEVGETRPSAHRPPPGGFSATRVGEEVMLSGAESACLRHRRGRAQSVRRALVPCGTGCQGTCHQVLVSRAPHRARCFLRAPAAGALRAVALFVGVVRGEQRSPPLREPGEFGTRNGEQGRGVRAVRELGQHVEPLSHRASQHLPQDLIHRNVTVTFSPAQRHPATRPTTGRGRWPTASRSGRAVRRAPPCPG